MGENWRNVRVSNPYPHPYEVITISGELWLVGPWPFPDRPADNNEITLTMDDFVLGKVRTDGNGRFSFTIGAPGAPGPYTYVLTRTDPWWPGFPHHLVGIEVVPEEDDENKRKKKYILMGIIGLEVLAGLVLLRRQ